MVFVNRVSRLIFFSVLILIAVIVSPVALQAQDTTTPEIVVQGFTEAYYDIEIGLPEAGRISGIKVKEGQLVKQGDVLLFLDKELQELEVSQSSLKLKSRDELKFAEKRKELLLRLAESAESLYKDGAASREDFETKQLEFAQAASEAARLKMSKKLEKIELDLAHEKLRRRILHAPVAGVVATISKAPGESVQAQEPLIRLVEADRGRFVGSAEESVGKLFSVATDACLSFTGTGMDAIPAKVTFLSPTIDTASGFMEIKAEFDNSEAMARLGGSAELFIMKEGNSDCRNSR
ncbi:efflux RND transporter periplasmic adaptor subunit [Maridesulfovibrio frigidus]|uniref:efflux RND transporter periplasmic adaptor subunit n=1 Tax=Maridesulfovibrio frigidus TaxID=340956 RepID=UPI0004E1FC66|nr:efflux RND transporter periplasmic adaptor subunit [Maridesulfovibrio frigidus]